MKLFGRLAKVKMCINYCYFIISSSYCIKLLDRVINTMCNFSNRCNWIKYFNRIYRTNIDWSRCFLRCRWLYFSDYYIHLRVKLLDFFAISWINHSDCRWFFGIPSLRLKGLIFSDCYVSSTSNYSVYY